MSDARKPDYNVSMMNDSGAKGRIGAAWTNDDGSIYIKLDAWVTVQGEGLAGQKVSIRLFPTSEEYQQRERKRRESKPVKFDDLEDDIPF